MPDRSILVLSPASAVISRVINSCFIYELVKSTKLAFSRNTLLSVPSGDPRSETPPCLQNSSSKTPPPCLQNSSSKAPPCLQNSSSKNPPPMPSEFKFKPPPPMPSEFQFKEPPKPSEFQKAVRGTGMDIFWNCPIFESLHVSIEGTCTVGVMWQQQDSA